MAYSPPGRSFLTGALDVKQMADNDFRENNPRFMGQALEDNSALVQRLEAFLRERGLSNSQVALAWILNKHSHVFPMPGTRRIACLESNVGSASIALTDAANQTLDALFAPSVVEGGRYPDAGFVGIESV